jgi:cation diffusion facilitator CzcD-associated flavoprotein CzcO
MAKVDTYCIIGGGPSGIGLGKCLTQSQIPFEIIEQEDNFGGNWYFGRNSARVYESTHLISSKLNTQFSDFPMPDSYPVYPNHKLFLNYLQDLANHFDLYKHARFSTTVMRVELEGEFWRVFFSDETSRLYLGVFIANGLQRISADAADQW